MNNKVSLKSILLIGFAFVTVSCGAIYTRMSKDEMDVKVTMSNTIWLDPVAPSNQTILVQMRNTSGITNFSELHKFIIGDLVSKGYKIEQDPDKAYYIMQINVKNAVLTSRKIDGKESALPGAVIGGIAGTTIGKGRGQVLSTLTGAVAGGIASMALDANTKDGYYDVTVDIRLGEKTKSAVKTSDVQLQKQGSEGGVISSSYEKKNRKYYTTVLHAVSNKVNLTEQEGSKAVKERIAAALSGLF